ncbi:hypothetical protein, partial [Pseudomonas sp. PS02286]|uniref:hypothetical protein n=1 Tax=Pseudomonas sp. PS02286 TaxID=2991442 RepID=UPI00249C1729
LAKAVRQTASFFDRCDAFASRLAPTGCVSDPREDKHGFRSVFTYTPRFGAGLYRLLATAHQWSGLVARVASYCAQASMRQVMPDPEDPLVTDLPHPDLEAQRLKQAADRALDNLVPPA